MKKALLFLFVLTYLHSNAQRTGKGIIVDEAHKALPFAVVMLMQDTALLASAYSEEDGTFLLRFGSIRDSALLQVSFVGYQTLVQKIALPTPDDTFDFGAIQLLPFSTQLEEAVVVAQREPIQMREDTVQFSASDYKTQPNAMAGELLKKMPGVELERDGTIRAKGETVKQILVNGKPYFGKDPQLALQSFPAEAIQSIQVFEKRSDQAEFSGVDNGEREMTINIVIKPDYNRRKALKVSAGAGDQGRYTARGNLNYFTETQKLTILASANNINKTGFSQDDFLAFANNNASSATSAANQIASNGFQSAQSGGFNFIDQRGKKSELNVSYFYTNKETLTDKTTRRQNFLPGRNYATQSQSDGFSGNANHRFNSYFDHKLDSFSSIRLQANVNSTDNFWQSVSQSENRLADTALQNAVQRKAANENAGLGIYSNLLLRRRFRKSGRTVSLNLAYNRNEAERYTITQAETRFYDVSTALVSRTDHIHQSDERENGRNNYVSTLSYTEPLSKRWLLEWNYRYSMALSGAKRQVDSLGNEEERFFRPEYSTEYRSDFSFHQSGVNGRYYYKKFLFSTGLQVQKSFLKGVFGTARLHLNTQYTYLLPKLRLSWNPTKERRLALTYDPFVREPSVEQLQPTQDNTDPLNLYSGNPELKPEYHHRIRMELTNYHKQTNSFLNGHMHLDYTENKIVNSIQIDSLYRRITQPINIQSGFLTADGAVSFGFRFWRQRLRLNWVSQWNLSEGANPVNNVLNLTKRWSASASPRIEWRFGEDSEVALRATARYQQIRYSIQTALNQNIWTQEIEAELTTAMPFGLHLNGVFEYSVFSSSILGPQPGIPIVNLALIKYLDQRNWEIRLLVVDALKRNTGIVQTAEANYAQEEIIRSLSRYGLLMVTYNLNRGQKAKDS
ncbi:MAG: TonB-dependent receptor [Haliscomenobacter sp.]|nr:TonB-dependent receptor [Haliscomenobacter sp.]